MQWFDHHCSADGTSYNGDVCPSPRHDASVAAMERINANRKKVEDARLADEKKKKQAEARKAKRAEKKGKK
jgi:hypothetical protein